MARPNVVPSDMKLYSPAEPKGRMFLGGEPWPGDAWSDRPGGDEVGRGTATQALKDLQAAEAQADDLRKIIESQGHDLAQASKVAEEAVAALTAATQAQADAEAALAEARAETTEALTERDAAREDAAQQRQRADDLDAKHSEARGRIQELETDLANAMTKLAAFDGDGDGKPGGSKAKG